MYASGTLAGQVVPSGVVPRARSSSEPAVGESKRARWAGHAPLARGGGRAQGRGGGWLSAVQHLGTGGSPLQSTRCCPSGQRTAPCPSRVRCCSLRSSALRRAHHRSRPRGAVSQPERAAALRLHEARLSHRPGRRPSSTGSDSRLGSAPGPRYCSCRQGLTSWLGPSARRRCGLWAAPAVRQAGAGERAPAGPGSAGRATSTTVCPYVHTAATGSTGMPHAPCAVRRAPCPVAGGRAHAASPHKHLAPQPALLSRSDCRPCMRPSTPAGSELAVLAAHPRHPGPLPSPCPRASSLRDTPNRRPAAALCHAIDRRHITPSRSPPESQR